MGRLVIVSGPSCVGKGPLLAALRKFYPDLAASLTPIVPYNDRRPRPGERNGVDYHFSSRADVEKLRKRPDFVVMEVRGDLQAVDLNEIRELLDKGDVFFEGNPFVACALLDSKLADADEVLSVFLSPLTRDEITYLSAPEQVGSFQDLLTDLMRRKLLRRTRKQKTILSLKDLENVERRAASAFPELKLAWRFPHVIPNHDGEDSENWDAVYYPLGDARRTLLTFVDLLEGRHNPHLETWQEGNPL